MRVCLVRPPSIISPTAYAGSLAPPVGLAYIASSLRAAGHQVDVIDGVGANPMRNLPFGNNLILRGLTFDEIIDRIPKDCKIIGISCMFSSEWVQTRDLVNQIAQALPDKLIIGGGEHFTAAAEFSMTQCPAITMCAVGEGEETMVELANAIDAKGDVEKVKGLVIKKGSEFIRTCGRARIRMIDDIPEPAWDLIPLDHYLDNFLGYGINRGRSMAMLASRGCPYQCTFCSNPLMWTTKWLARDPKLVADEIEKYIARYKITNVDFYDLTAIVRREWIIEFCKELVTRNIKITWQLPSGTRSEAIDGEVAKWLFESGCRNLSYAPESGSEKTLKNMKKKVKLPRLLESLRLSVREGINVKVNIIIGIPDDQHIDVWRTFLFLIRASWNGAHDVSLGVFSPYPGSELYDRLVKEGKISHSDEYFNKLAYVDITRVVSYTDHISSRWLSFYNWFGLIIFYGSNYLFRPQRFFRTLKNLITDRHESRGEMALSNVLKRLKVAKNLTKDIDAAKPA
jgi:anaerobic magnesium-protoporphyrin IX monomethyl ester cyclase